MSRIILSKHDDGSNHVVVGWDHPAHGAFWQEYGSKAEVAAAEEVLKACEETGAEPDIATETLAETEVKRNGGMWPGLKLKDLVADMPEEFRPLMTEKVMDMLSQHSEDPDSGYGPITIHDLTTGYSQ